MMILVAHVTIHGLGGQTCCLDQVIIGERMSRCEQFAQFIDGHRALAECVYIIIGGREDRFAVIPIVYTCLHPAEHLNKMGKRRLIRRQVNHLGSTDAKIAQ